MFAMFEKFITAYKLSKQNKSEFISRVHPLSLPSLIATWFGFGLISPGPGTWGTLGGFISVWIFVAIWSAFGGGGAQILLAVPCVTIVLFGAGLWASRKVEEKTGHHDSSFVVIDEVVAVWVIASFFPPATIYLHWAAVSFLIFRFFDIFKPGPIGWVDKRVSSAWGVMLDDLLAALFTLILLWVPVLYILYHLSSPELD